MRIHVTGLGGFIGSSLGPALAARGHEVRRGGMEGCDAVVHLANIAHARAERDRLWKVNVDGTVATAEAAAKAGVRRFIYMSSAKAAAPDDEYGRAKLAAAAGVELVGRVGYELAAPMREGVLIAVAQDEQRAADSDCRHRPIFSACSALECAAAILSHWRFMSPWKPPLPCG